MKQDKLKLVDSHCHLEAEEFNGILDSVISDASGAGIVKLITSSVTPGEWDLSRSIHEKYPEVEYSIGVHPWYVTENDLNIRKKLEAEVTPEVVAIGEIGLDRKIETPHFDLQYQVFILQLQFAIDADRPVIMHCRGAFNELIEALKKNGFPKRGGIIHAYSGSPELTGVLMKMGVSFSMGGTLTYRNSGKRASVLKMIYPENFLLETDSPDIPPVNSPKPNVPSNILLNLKAASEILGVAEEKIAADTTENAKRIFGLDI